MFENNQKQLYTAMNTTKKKNVVILTESDLHKVIKRCVNETLNELDWKTYANAAEKQRSRDFDNSFANLRDGKGYKESHPSDERRRKFAQACADQYREDHLGGLDDVFSYDQSWESNGVPRHIEAYRNGCELSSNLNLEPNVVSKQRTLQMSRTSESFLQNLSFG